MSYVVQILCVIAALAGLLIVTTKVESEQVRVAALYVVVGVPAILIYLAWVGRTIVEKVTALEKRLDEGSKTKSV